MDNILRILVPVDFSKESELALDWGVRVAQNNAGATIYLMHALPLAESPKNLGMASVGYEMEIDAIKHKMKVWQDRLPAEILSFSLYETGPVAKAVAGVCEAKNIDLVVMTTRGRRGMTHILEGSITEETVRLAPCPVLVLHLNARTYKQAHVPAQA